MSWIKEPRTGGGWKWTWINDGKGNPSAEGDNSAQIDTSVTAKPVRSDLWDKYIAQASAYGVTPMSVADFNSKMGEISDYGNQGAEKIREVNKKYANEILRPLFDTVKAKIKTSYDTYYDAQKANGNEMPYAPPDIATFNASEDIETSLSNLDTLLSNPYAVTTKLATDLPKEKEVYKPSELMLNEETRMHTEAGEMANPNYVAGGKEPQWIANPDFKDAVRPEYNYDPSTSAKYFDTISAAEKDSTGQAVNAVNEQANMLNPYATGSGSQLRAVSGMLDKITANQQARAFAMGANAYDRNYAGQYADFEKKQAAKSSARKGLLDLANFYQMSADAKDQNDYNRMWNTFTAQNAINRDNALQSAEDRRIAREDEIAAQAARMEAETNKQEWWQPFAQAAVSGLAGGLAGGLTNVLTGNTVANKLKLLNGLGKTGAQKALTAGVDIYSGGF
jgi:hypothetical protein